MKKLKSLKEFNNLNSNSVLSNTELTSVFGGKVMENTGDMCVTLNDTCVNGREDMYHHTEIDGVVTCNSTTWVN